MNFNTDDAILLFAVLLIIGVLTTKFSSRLGMPSLVLYIVVGMVLSRFIYYDNAQLTQLFGILALIVILFEGGMQTKWKQVKPVIAPSISLATLGVLFTTLTIGFFAKYILGLSWVEGLLFGAIVGSTDAAAVFAVLGNKNIKKRITSTLEAESGTNDPMAVFLTIALIEWIQNPDAAFLSLLFSFILQMGVGLIAGIVFGKIAVWSINRINLDSSGLYPVLAMAFAVLTYSSTALLHGSGLLAVYIMALIFGNADVTYRHSIFRFNEGFAWMMQILMFILLGLLVFPHELTEIVGEGLILSFLLMFIARPIGVWISTLCMGFNMKEKVLISWAGLRGAVPIVLATYPLTEGLENGQLFFNVVFFVVFTSALIQGATISPLADKLGLAGEAKQQVPYTLELVSIGKTNSEMVEVQIEALAPVVDKAIHEIKLPHDSLISAIVRGEQLITPRGDTVLREGDILYMIVSKQSRDEAKLIFAAADSDS
ncbi:potassium/proton antiporter [Marinicrinis lubricantis]|uniref:Potassium/proton antiporter n=1 Tax=Marinicrinis lubricantis TaxID=2086470 RepID=A0ABW1IL64_9BACL